MPIVRTGYQLEAPGFHVDNALIGCRDSIVFVQFKRHGKTLDGFSRKIGFTCCAALRYLPDAA